MNSYIPGDGSYGGEFYSPRYLSLIPGRADTYLSRLIVQQFKAEVQHSHRRLEVAWMGPERR